MKYTFLKRWGIGFLLIVAVLGGLRLKPWKFFETQVAAESLKVGFLPVT